MHQTAGYWKAGVNQENIMQAFKLDQPVPELQPIGSVSLLGATPTEGDPQVAGLWFTANRRTPLPAVCFHRGSFTHDLPVYRTRHRAGRRS